jgi:phosphatidylglycerol:prolipoprotein diacylglycerol transferase
MIVLAAHPILDIAASALALLATWIAYDKRLRGAVLEPEGLGAGYPLALIAGAALGGYGLGTLNLYLSGVEQVGRSILGALAGAILAVEFYKWRRGISGSTGVVFVVGFATTVAVGRVGCYLSGLGDQTHGIPTALPWGHDFGDGIPRHPVQLYESAVMAAFLAGAAIALRARSRLFLRNGFYLMVAVYAAQRFAWEFLKPYGTLIGPLNLFHLVCAALFAYAAAMMARVRDG